MRDPGRPGDAAQVGPVTAIDTNENQAEVTAARQPARPGESLDRGRDIASRMEVTDVQEIRFCLRGLSHLRWRGAEDIGRGERNDNDAF